MTKTTHTKKPFATLARRWPKVKKELDRRSSGALRGLRSGFSKLDERLSGIHGLTILGGNPGVGKSTFAAQLAWQVAELNSSAVILYLSAEMSGDEVHLRIANFLSKRAGSRGSKHVEADDLTTMFKDVGRRFVIEGPNLLTPTHELVERVKDFKEECEATHALIVVDSIHAIASRTSPARAGTQKELLDSLLVRLRSLADVEGNAVIAISHLTKAGDDGVASIPFSGSASLSFEPDYAAILSTSGVSSRTFKLKKSRYGAPEPVRFEFHADENRFEEASLKPSSKPTAKRAVKP